MAPDLSLAFLDVLSPELAGEMAQVDDLDRQLSTAWKSATSSWPDLQIPPEAFMAYLAERLPTALPRGQRIGGLVAPDLYLACGCARGDAAALTLFDRHLRPEIEAALARLTAPDHLLSEILQTLSEQLLVAHPDAGPAIAKYGGRGQIRGWLRVISVRAAIKILDREMKEVPVADSMLEDLSGASVDPELRLLHETYCAEFRQAFRDALASLPSKDRALLKMHFFDALNIDALGKAFGVHRATAARWLATARQTLLDRTHTGLSARLAIEPGEVQSLLRLIDDPLSVTFRSLLQGGQDEK